MPKIYSATTYNRTDGVWEDPSPVNRFYYIDSFPFEKGTFLASGGDQWYYQTKANSYQGWAPAWNPRLYEPVFLTSGLCGNTMAAAVNDPLSMFGNLEQWMGSLDYDNYKPVRQWYTSDLDRVTVCLPGGGTTSDQYGTWWSGRNLAAPAISYAPDATESLVHCWEQIDSINQNATSWSYSTVSGVTTVTVNSQDHGLSTGTWITVTGALATTNAPNGIYVVNGVSGANGQTSFTYLAELAPTGSAAGTLNFTATVYRSWGIEPERTGTRPSFGTRAVMYYGYENLNGYNQNAVGSNRPVRSSLNWGKFNFFMGTDTSSVWYLGMEAENTSTLYKYDIRKYGALNRNLVETTMLSNVAPLDGLINVIPQLPSNLRRDSSTRYVIYSSHMTAMGEYQPQRIVWNPSAGTVVATTCTVTYPNSLWNNINNYSLWLDGTAHHNIQGTGDWLNLSTGSYTIEFWVYPETGQHGTTQLFNSGGTTNSRIVIQRDRNGRIDRYTGASDNQPVTLGGGYAPSGQWTHICLAKNNGQSRLHINGQLISNPYMETQAGGIPTSHATTANRPYIGTNGSTTPNASVYISDLRINKFDVYAPQSGGWSVSFDGTDDRLSVPDDAKYYPGSGNFTIECWAYAFAFDTANMIFEKGVFATQKEFRAYFNSTQIILDLCPTATNAYTTITATLTNELYRWYHLAFTRVGNHVSIYRDGVRVQQVVFSSTIIDAAETMHIGGARDANNAYMQNGYISDLRFIIGQGITSATTFIPPNAPLTTSDTGWYDMTGSQFALSGTVALLLCNSSTFVDSSASPVAVTSVAGTPYISDFNPTRWNANFNPPSQPLQVIAGGTGTVVLTFNTSSYIYTTVSNTTTYSINKTVYSSSRFTKFNPYDFNTINKLGPGSAAFVNANLAGASLYPGSRTRPYLEFQNPITLNGDWCVEAYVRQNILEPRTLHSTLTSWTTATTLLGSAYNTGTAISYNNSGTQFYIQTGTLRLILNGQQIDANTATYTQNSFGYRSVTIQVTSGDLIGSGSWPNFPAFVRLNGVQRYNWFGGNNGGSQFRTPLSGHAVVVLDEVTCEVIYADAFLTGTSAGCDSLASFLYSLPKGRLVIMYTYQQGGITQNLRNALNATLRTTIATLITPATSGYVLTHIVVGQIDGPWGPYELLNQTGGAQSTSPIFSYTAGNLWTHVAWCKETVGSITHFAYFVNGIRSFTTSTSISYDPVTVNRIADHFVTTSTFITNENKFNGWISNLRITTGTTVYGTGTTISGYIPATTLTTSTQTRLLMFTNNQSIVDLTTWTNTFTNLDPFGLDVAPSFESPFRSQGSLNLKGLDYLVGSISDANQFEFGLGDFTIEYWIYHYGVTSPAVLATNRNIQDYTTGSWLLEVSPTSISFREGVISGTGLSGTFTSILNQWTHFAIVRSGANLQIYKGGTLLSSSDAFGSVDYSVQPNPYPLIIGTQERRGSKLRAFVHDMRILKGAAQYTSNFTAPTGELIRRPGLTSLLAFRLNTSIADESDSTKVFSQFGFPSTVAYSPFNDFRTLSASSGTMVITGTNTGLYLDAIGSPKTYYTEPVPSSHDGTGYNAYWTKAHQFVLGGYVYITMASIDKLVSVSSTSTSRFVNSKHRTWPTFRTTNDANDDLLEFHSGLKFQEIVDFPLSFVPGNSIGTKIITFSTSSVVHNTFDTTDITATGWSLNTTDIYRAIVTLYFSSNHGLLPNYPITVTGIDTTTNPLNGCWKILDCPTSRSLRYAVTLAEAYLPQEYELRSSESSSVTFTYEAESTGRHLIQYNYGITASTDLSIEFWIYLPGYLEHKDSNYYYARLVTGHPVSNSFDISLRSSGPFDPIPSKIAVTSIGSNNFNLVSPALAVNQSAWHHIAFTRESNSNSIFFNGIRVANTSSSYVFVSGGYLNLGGSSDTAIGASATRGNFSGSISNLRIGTGTVIYSANTTTITVPTAELDSTTYATPSLLVFQKGTILDYSANNYLATIINENEIGPAISESNPFPERVESYSQMGLRGTPNVKVGWRPTQSVPVSARGYGIDSYGNLIITSKPLLYGPSQAHGQAHAQTEYDVHVIKEGVPNFVSVDLVDSITGALNTFRFNGLTQQSTVKINAFDLYGQRMSVNLSLTIEGSSMTFSGGSRSLALQTNASADTTATVLLVGSGRSNISVSYII